MKQKELLKLQQPKIKLRICAFLQYYLLTLFDRFNSWQTTINNKKVDFSKLSFDEKQTILNQLDDPHRRIFFNIDQNLVRKFTRFNFKNADGGMPQHLFFSTSELLKISERFLSKKLFSDVKFTRKRAHKLKNGFVLHSCVIIDNDTLFKLFNLDNLIDNKLNLNYLGLSSEEITTERNKIFWNFIKNNKKKEDNKKKEEE